MEQKRTVLVVEDEKSIVDILRFNLEKEGYAVLTAYDGESGLEQAVNGGADLILLDVMLPKMNGFDVCRRLREKGSSVPVIILTAREEEADKVLGLEIGADDYITKPFSMPILLRKLAAVLRRAGGGAPGRCLRYRGLTLDPDAVEVRLDGRVLEQLTAREFELLRELLSSPGRVFTREILLAKLWGYDFFGDERVVDSHIKNLRKKLGVDYIETVRGVGYRVPKEHP